MAAARTGWRVAVWLQTNVIRQGKLDDWSRPGGDRQLHGRFGDRPGRAPCLVLLSPARCRSGVQRAARWRGAGRPASWKHDCAIRAGAEQRYLPNTAVLETVLADREGGRVRVIDFCPRFRRYGRIFRPPMLVRRIEPLAGRPRITVALRPTFDYGAARPAAASAATICASSARTMVLRVTTDMSLSYLTHEPEFALDRPINLFIGPDEPVPEASELLARQFLDETVDLLARLGARPCTCRSIGRRR